MSLLGLLFYSNFQLLVFLFFFFFFSFRLIGSKLKANQTVVVVVVFSQSVPHWADHDQIK